jgi:hypothetical protein
MLIECLEKEWKMTLPDPIPLAIHDSCVSCIQLKDAMIGFKMNKKEKEKMLLKGKGGGEAVDRKVR